jgi:acyl-CoA reductase-like NAD-dependent aldehyde dehydrogenase
METTQPPIVGDRTDWSEALEQALAPLLHEVSFAQDERILAEGSPSDSFFLIDQGDVRIEARTAEVDTDPVLAYQGRGSMLGDVGALTGEPRSASAYAQTDVLARRVFTDDLERLYGERPDAGLVVARALGHATAGKLVRATERLAGYLVADIPDPDVDEMVAAASDAQLRFEGWPEDRVDALLLALANAVAERAERLAAASVEETTIGNVDDKVLKVRFAALGVYAAMVGQPGFGVLAVDELRKVTEIASPVGVVFGLVPVTNPISTFINKTLICLKSRNAVILSCHRATQRTADQVGELVQTVLRECNAPVELVQWVRGRTSRQRTANFMRHPGIGLVLATGGPSMVKAAYSCGKPAIGVGAGNAPVWIASDADIDAAARSVIESKVFDNGLTCGAEQHLVVERPLVEEFISALKRHGAAVLDEQQTAQLIAGAFDPESGDLLIQYVGRTAAQIADAGDLEVGEDVRLLVFRADADRPEGAAARERLAPVLSLFVVEGERDAIGLCEQLLSSDGAGHTAVVHTSDPERAGRFAIAMPASRILINAPAAQGCSGVLSGLWPSLTLGCGTFGGNSTSDNVNHTHVRNVKRAAELNYGNLLKFNRLVRKL